MRDCVDKFCSRRAVRVELGGCKNTRLIAANDNRSGSSTVRVTFCDADAESYQTEAEIISALLLCEATNDN
jgi:hypothetical protein